MDVDRDKLAGAMKDLARQVGFDLVGISSAEPLPEAGRRLARAVELGYTAGMGYLGRNPGPRSEPKAFKQWANSVVCVGINYNSVPPGPTDRGLPRLISRYALGRDYHLVVAEKLQKLAGEVSRLLGREFRWAAAVDTSPVMEKPLAKRAGIGWQGKNTLIINEEFGSWVFLGELFTDLALTVDRPAQDQCGDCRACIKACPTGALSEPGVLDARKCLSYLTVEHKGEFSAEMVQKVQTVEKETGGCLLFGCDICQEACPFNQDRPKTKEKQFEPRQELLEMSADKAGQMTEASFREVFSDTAVSRLSYRQFQRNVRRVLDHEAREEHEAGM